MEQLLTRLRNGEGWLRETSETLLDMEAVGRGTELEATFLYALELWDDLDKLIRGLYPDFTGCVLGVDKTCVEDAPIRCRFCSSVEGGCQTQNAPLGR